MGRLSVEKKEAKKDRIIEKSMELFKENGYHATKVETITKALGISKGNFYTYFNSKEEVLYEILDIMKEQRIDFLHEIDVDKDPKEVLRDFAESHRYFFLRYLKRVNLQNIEVFLKDKKIIVHIEEIQDILIEFLQKNVVERMEGSKNKGYNFRFIAEFIFISMEGLFLDTCFTEELELKKKYEMTMEEKIEQITEFINNTLK
jgi:tetR/acrR family transcriptional regulator